MYLVFVVVCLLFFFFVFCSVYLNYCLLAGKLYGGADYVDERHRHRFEVRCLHLNRYPPFLADINPVRSSFTYKQGK